MNTISVSTPGSSEMEPKSSTATGNRRSTSQLWRHEGDDGKKYKRWDEEEVPPFLESYGKNVLIYRGKELWCAIQQDLHQKGILKSPWSLEKKWNNILRRFRQNNSEGTFAHYDKVKSILDSRMAWHRWVPLRAGTKLTKEEESMLSPPEDISLSTKTASTVEGEKDLVTEGGSSTSLETNAYVDLFQTIEKHIVDLKVSHQRETREREELLTSVINAIQNIRNNYLSGS